MRPPQRDPKLWTYCAVPGCCGRTWAEPTIGQYLCAHCWRVLPMRHRLGYRRVVREEHNTGPGAHLLVFRILPPNPTPRAARVWRACVRRSQLIAASLA